MLKYYYLIKYMKNYFSIYCVAAIQVGLILVFLSSCMSKNIFSRVIHLDGPTMGTKYHVSINESLPKKEYQVLHHEIEAILEAINEKMSTYQGDSELSHLNLNPDTTWINISPDLFSVIDEAMYVSRITNGAFDITVGDLVNLWGFGPSIQSSIVPSDASIDRVMRGVGYKHLHVQRASSSIRKDIPGLYIDLSGIAKGYAVDQVALHLEAQGVMNYLIEIGGELKANGKNKNNIGWEVIIERPVPLVREKYAAVNLRNMAIATSGDYRNYIERDGKRFSHTINPTTGKPITHTLASVTVINSSAMRADAFATGLMVLGPEEGYEIAVRESLAAFFIVKKNDIFESKSTPMWRKYVSVDI